MINRIGDWQRRGRFWHNLITGRIIPVIAGGALPFTDTFTAGSDTTLVIYSSNWTQNSGLFNVLGTSSDDVRSAGSGDEFLAHNETNTYNDNQYAQAVINSLSTSSDIGVAVRVAAGTTDSGYGFYADANNSGDSYLFKNITGTATYLGSTGGAAVSDTFRLEANGTTITPLINGSTTGTPGAQTDSSLTSGYAGLCGWGGASDARVDNFEGGNLSTTHTVTVNQVTETDTPQAITKRKIRAVGQNTETDTAQAVTKQKLLAVAQISETDTAQATNRQKILALGQISETDTAQPIARGQQLIPVAQVTETDTAQAVTTRKQQTAGQVTETDTAHAVTFAFWEQEGYRFRNDDGSETTATWNNAQDAGINIGLSEAFRLRVLINATGDLPASAFRIEYRVAGSVDPWTVIEA